MLLSTSKTVLGQARPALPKRACKVPARRPAVVSGRTQLVAKAVLADAPTKNAEKPVTMGTGSADPWNDPKYAGIKWTVYRGKAYNLTPYMQRHPGGSWLINLAVGRDCTALFESSHLRPDVAISHLKRLPVIEDFPIDAVPRSPYPNDSEIYCAIRERVRKEVFKGQDAKGAHRTGSEGAALAVISYSVAAWLLYAWDTNPATGFLLGLAGAWIGLTIQHCGNHGAMSTNPIVNNMLGLTDDLTGGSSLMWRYHHQVSHHIHCNDDVFDEDVMNAAPFLRFDPRQPRYWYHQFQHIYMWATFPFLNLVFQWGDIKALIENRTVGATLYGASDFEKSTVIMGKLAHYTLLWFVPLYLHGGAATVSGALAYIVTQSVVLAGTFAVSHNVPEAKPLDAGVTRETMYESSVADRDWGVQQIVTSANWGGVVGNFFTGGLNLQIEHHLFPAVAFMHYPAISAIVRDECRKRGVPYNEYDTLPEILGRFVRYMKEVGAAPEQPVSRAPEAQPELLARV